MNYPGHYEVDSVGEAVALAEKLRAAGAYNIFRGQTVDWPMRSSLSRLRPPKLAGGKQRLLEFATFVGRTPELVALRGDRFGVMAIAQHHGIPTFLVDFTTNPAVAGWFASHGDASKEGRPSVIYLAHEEFIAQQYRDRLPELYTRRIAVENLWRLQAQAGLFLHLPFADDPALDQWLAEAFGSIRFPFRGPTGDIPPSAIYPDRKSRLEILFDGFLTEERLREVHAGWRSLGVPVVSVPETEPRRPAPAFIGDYAPPVHGSWIQPDTAAWARPPAETFRRQDHPPEVLLEVGAAALQDADSGPLQQQLAARIQEFMAGQENARAGFVNFRLQLPDSQTSLDGRVHPDSRLRRTVKQDLADCWDGMRLFPYSDTVICQALAYLATAWARVHGRRQSLYQATNELLGTNLLAEFGLKAGGQHAMAPVPETEFIAALRGDLSGLLKPEDRELRTKPTQLLHQVYEPGRLFDFDRFVVLFGHRFVPGQFLIRQREVVLFSPMGIERLGNR